MTSAELITWIIMPVTVVAFLLGYTFLMGAVHRREVLLIENGIRDSKIQTAYEKDKNKTIVGKIVSIILEVILFIFLAGLIFIGIYSASFSNNFPIMNYQVKIIGSNSMATVHKNNQEYINENNLNNRFKFDDILIIHNLPEEDDLNQYDIITYVDSKSGLLIVHRIFSIEETSNGKVYTMRGDANGSSDAKTITYSDMRGIYTGEKIVGAGSIIRFVQSPFGIMVILFALYIFVLEEYYNRKINKLDKKRLAKIKQGENIIKIMHDRLN